MTSPLAVSFSGREQDEGAKPVVAEQVSFYCPSCRIDLVNPVDVENPPYSAVHIDEDHHVHPISRNDLVEVTR